jgi:hypothetical protein
LSKLFPFFGKRNFSKHRIFLLGNYLKEDSKSFFFLKALQCYETIQILEFIIIAFSKRKSN